MTATLRFTEAKPCLRSQSDQPSVDVDSSVLTLKALLSPIPLSACCGLLPLEGRHRGGFTACTTDFGGAISC